MLKAKNPQRSTPPARDSNWSNRNVTTRGFKSPAVLALRIARDCLLDANRAQIVPAPVLETFIQRIDALRESHDPGTCAQLSADIRSVAESLRDDSAPSAHKQVVHRVDAAADLVYDASQH